MLVSYNFFKKIFKINKLVINLKKKLNFLQYKCNNVTKKKLFLSNLKLLKFLDVKVSGSLINNSELFFNNNNILKNRYIEYDDFLVHYNSNLLIHNQYDFFNFNTKHVELLNNSLRYKNNIYYLDNLDNIPSYDNYYKIYNYNIFTWNYLDLKKKNYKYKILSNTKICRFVNTFDINYYFLTNLMGQLYEDIIGNILFIDDFYIKNQYTDALDVCDTTTNQVFNKIKVPLFLTKKSNIINFGNIKLSNSLKYLKLFNILCNYNTDVNFMLFINNINSEYYDLLNYIYSSMLLSVNKSKFPVMDFSKRFAFSLFSKSSNCLFNCLYRYFKIFNMNNQRKVIVLLKSFNYDIFSIFLKNNGVKGVYIRVTGKVCGYGGSKAKYFTIKYGQFSRSSLHLKTDHFSKHLTTKAGSVGLTVILSC